MRSKDRSLIAGTIWLTSLASLPFAPQLIAVAHAQSPAPTAPTCSRTVAVTGRPCTGLLLSGDPQANDRRYHEYNLVWARGEGLEIRMESDQVNSALELYRSADGPPLAANEDSMPNIINARLYFFPPAGGDYRLRALGGARQIGSYTLTVARLPAPPPPVALSANRDVSGALGEDSPVMEDPSSLQQYRYGLYAFEGRDGERVQIEMLSGEMDSRLELFDDRNPPFHVVNGFWPNTRNARLLAVLPRTGRYTVRAQAPVDQPGNYRLTFRQMAAPAPEEPEELPRDRPVTGEIGLESGIQLASGGSGQIQFLYKTYWLEVTAGETVTIDLVANLFDPVLEAGVDSPLGFALAASDDDGGDVGVNSRLTLRPASGGRIFLRARTLGLGRGNFTLSVSQTSPPPPPGN